MTYTSSTELERITFVLMLSAAELITSKGRDRKSTRLNSSHSQISYAVFCLKKKKKTYHRTSDYGNQHIDRFAHLGATSHQNDMHDSYALNRLFYLHGSPTQNSLTTIHLLAQ